eukprot:CAMPEP_0176018260 /NCGR_PEP_ID=MMETSP0120_2-20121206/8786_1 /TAXON_ID=160619 /ORGANISM="Kryptoperidinium foliaceum, Strain CCMP 1326" /LENGTH=134 /DNA_ID=CAMNT_0017351305 /DNA_START=267 /DNA_END=669 /DNA_ORIENTATION=+
MPPAHPRLESPRHPSSTTPRGAALLSVRANAAATSWCGEATRSGSRAFRRRAVWRRNPICEHGGGGIALKLSTAAPVTHRNTAEAVRGSLRQLRERAPASPRFILYARGEAEVAAAKKVRVCNNARLQVSHPLL